MLQEVLQRVAIMCGVSSGDGRPTVQRAVSQLLARHYAEPTAFSPPPPFRPQLNSVLAKLVVEFAVPRDRLVVLSRTGLEVVAGEARGFRSVRALPPPGVECVGIAASQTNICGICGLGVVVLNRDFSVQRTYYNGHSHPVLSVAVTDDGLYVATGGCDAAVVVWSVEYGPLSVLSAHNDWVRYLRFTRGPVGKLLLVSAGDDGLMVLWDPLTGLALALVEAFAGHAIRAMDVTQRMIVASGDYQPLSGAAAAPAALHGADDAHRIVSPGTFSVFELDAQRMTICESSGGPLVAHETCPTVCAISPGEEFLVSAAEDERLCVSSIARRVVLWTCAAFASKRRCMSFMNVGTSIKVLACPPMSSVIVVVACGSDGDVVQWIVDPRSGSSQLVRKMLSIGPLIDMAIVTV